MTRAVVFDLDGTLIDSVPDLHVAVNRMLADAGKSPLTLAEVMAFVGNGIPNLVKCAMEAREIPMGDHGAMIAAMLGHYARDPVTLTRIYDGVPETLSTLRGEGYRLGVCTNKSYTPTLQILTALNLDSLFDVVIGGDSLPVRKPDPAPLHASFRALGASGVFVGDSEVDAETGQRAMVPFALYTRGYRKTPVEALPHDAVFDDFAQLPQILQRLTAA
ncbi:phosphoglycolate phosphatase [Palleronia caenipelagi]|uniref:Phosphoglycolate phosphatase n=1 Tax=Palleronia caenipelagi TaxID=2489174 RepID=A0A547Q6Q2_9RHOB|nr:phosphoglycolate phosphatase [Palleronia caenipelagi]TRD22065.1 phosphoglycolate phosphatase [Palleronia caenipelagi]